jgi:dipeptide transport system substrate-binding protein
MKTLLIISTLFYNFLIVNTKAVTFVYCSEGSPSAFNPQVTSDGTSNNASAHTIFERLVDFKQGTTDLEPSLASSWTISKNKKVYTFTIRKDVEFHNTKYFTPTRTLNANDILFSFNRMHDKKNSFHQVGGAKYEYYFSMAMEEAIKSIVKINDYKVEITLTKANSSFLANLAMSFMSIHSKEYADILTSKNNKKDIDHLPVGTGPFVFKKYVKDNIIRYKRHEKYWGTLPHIKKLLFAITPDASVRVQKLKAGECDFISAPPPSDIKSLQENPKIKVVSQAGANVGYLAMNTTKKPLNSLKVRKAISHALNKKSYIKAIYLDTAQVAKNPIPPTMWAYNNNVKDDSYNPKLSKKLLKEAGFEKGLELELWTLPVSRPYNPNGKKMGELMQADLAKVGIKIKLISYDWPTYLNKSKNGEHSLLQLGWSGDNGDPDNFLYTLLSCNAVKAGANVAKWCDKRFNKHVVDARTFSSKKKRTILYKKAQLIFKEQAPWVTLAHAKVFRAMNKKVAGFIIDPLGADIFKSVTIK